MSADATDPPAAAAAGQQPIYVVDDDPSVRESMGILLDALGFTVITYGSAAELLADASRVDARCVIVDHHMPGMSGLDMLSALRREGSTVSAILVTGRLDVGIAARAAELGVCAVLEKPFCVKRLVAAVHQSQDRR